MSLSFQWMSGRHWVILKNSWILFLLLTVIQYNILLYNIIQYNNRSIICIYIFKCWMYLIAHLNEQYRRHALACRTRQLEKLVRASVVTHWVKPLFSTLTSHEERLSCSASDPTPCYWPEPQHLGPCHRVGDQEGNWFLTWAWPSLGCCSPLGNEPKDGKTSVFPVYVILPFK